MLGGRQTQRPVEAVKHPVEAVSGTQSRAQMAEKYFWRGPLHPPHTP